MLVRFLNNPLGYRSRKLSPSFRWFCLDRMGVPKEDIFYVEEANKHRHYFYFMDTRGQVFLEETVPRNIATCMKDIKFLDFLIRFVDSF